MSMRLRIHEHELTPEQAAARAHHRLLAREALASALYLALVLLTALVAVPEEQLPSDRAIVQLIFGAGLGLLVAHWFAFRLAARITTEEGHWSPTASQEVAAQLLGGLAVCVLGSLPFLLFDGRTALVESLLLLSALPAVAGGWIARLQGRSWSFAVYSGVLAFLVGCAIVAIKTSLSH